jgi:hypothetical protein
MPTGESKADELGLERCGLCDQVLMWYHHQTAITVDLDPGNPEVGPDPDIQTVGVHNVCARDPETARKVAKHMRTILAESV